MFKYNEQRFLRLFIKTESFKSGWNITKTEIMRRLPDISQDTVQRTLAGLLKNNEIVKIGGRYTSYSWNRENEL